jgi:hypothetical protein
MNWGTVPVRRPNIEGILVTGQLGIGTSLVRVLQKNMDRLAHVLKTCRKISFFFFDGNSTSWIFLIQGETLGSPLSDSNEHSRHPCNLFQWFSKEKQAFIVTMVQAVQPIFCRRPCLDGPSNVSGCTIGVRSVMDVHSS